VDISSTRASFVFYASAIGKIQEVVIHLIYTTRQDLLFVVIMDEIFHGDGPYYSMGDGHYESMGNGQSMVDFDNKPQGENKIIMEGNHDRLIINEDEVVVISKAVPGNLETIYRQKFCASSSHCWSFGRHVFQTCSSLVR
jgi:elongator complex protein 1